MERVLICGDRHWTDYDLLHNWLVRISERTYIECVIEGEARGADSIGRAVAVSMGIPFLPVPADWVKYGRAAGPIRNMEMLMKGDPTLVLAFHDNIEASKGTKDMVGRAKKANIPTAIISHRGIMWVCQPNSSSRLGSL